jgi:hypothetical protein
VKYEEDYMNLSRFLRILVLMFIPLSLFAAEQRITVPITPAPPVTSTPVVQESATTLAPPPPVEAVVPQAPVPADVSRQPAGAPTPGLQPMPGAARSGSPLPALAPTSGGLQLPGARKPYGAVPVRPTPAAPAMPAMQVPTQPAVLVPVPLAPQAPSTPLPLELTANLSDYAISGGTAVSAGKWTFTVRNLGNAEPTFSKSGSAANHHIWFAVGKPCATAGDWHKYPSQQPLPILGPGKQSLVSFSMDKAHIDNGCPIRAEMQGPDNDVNTSNNMSVTQTKAVLLPDLVLTNLDGQGKWPGGSIVVKNIGNAPAGPSTFHFYCASKESGVSCGTWGEKLKAAVDRDMPGTGLAARGRLFGHEAGIRSDGRHAREGFLDGRDRSRQTGQGEQRAKQS